MERVVTSSADQLGIMWDAKLRCYSQGSWAKQRSICWGADNSLSHSVRKSLLLQFTGEVRIELRLSAELALPTQKASLLRQSICKHFGLSLFNRNLASAEYAVTFSYFSSFVHTYTGTSKLFTSWMSAHVQYFTHFHLVSFCSNAYASKFLAIKKGHLHFVDICFLMVL